MGPPGHNIGGQDSRPPDRRNIKDPCSQAVEGMTAFNISLNRVLEKDHEILAAQTGHAAHVALIPECTYWVQHEKKNKLETIFRKCVLHIKSIAKARR